MASEVVTHCWCDICLSAQVHEPGVPVQVTLGFANDARALVMDMCESHRKEFVDPLGELLAKHARNVEPKRPYSRARSNSAKAEGPFRCLVPGCAKTERLYPNLGALTSHVRHRHGLKVNDYRQQYGIVPVDQSAESPEEDQEQPAVYACTAKGCDKTYSSPPNKRPAQALAVHRSRAHGIKSDRR